MFHGTTLLLRSGALGLVVLLSACGGGGGGGSQPAAPPQPVVLLAALGAPTVSGITEVGAQVTTSITLDGGGAITARGVVWGPNVNPSLSDARTQDGTGTGTFTSTLAGLTAGTTYHVRAYATNAAGTAFSADTTFRTLDPETLPLIASGPTSTIVVAGRTASFRVTASGNPAPLFQWQVLRPGGDWTPMAGAISDTYTTGPLSQADDGLKVRVLASNRVGTAISESATIQVQWGPSISSQPTETAVVLGTQATFRVGGTANPLPSCQWQRSRDGGATWTDLAGAISMTFTLTPLAADDGALFRASLANLAGSAVSQAARLAVRNGDGTPVLDADLLRAKLDELKLTIPSWTGVQVRGLTPEQFSAGRPAATLPFEIGYLADDGSVFISEPLSAAQRAVFRNAQQGASFYLAQAMLRQWYGTTRLPLWLGTGFGAFKAGIRPSTDRIRAEVGALGRKPTLLELEDPAFFTAHQGLDFAATFGEWICVFYDSMVLRWDLRINPDGSQTFNIGQTIRTRDDLTRVWHMLLDGFHLDTSSRRVELQETSELVDYWYADVDASYMPNLRQLLEASLTDYFAKLGITPKARFTFLMQPTKAMHYEWGGWPYDPNGTSIGGGGVSGFKMVSPGAAPQGDGGAYMVKHEFAHTAQMQVRADFMPAWLSEGFPDAIQNSPFTASAIASRKAQVQASAAKAAAFYGHRPTLKEMEYYANLFTEYNYYDLGGPMVDFVVRNWGWPGVEALILNRAQDVTVLGLKGADEFMARYYAFFDETWAK
jgi:hypothetical protein